MADNTLSFDLSGSSKINIYLPDKIKNLNRYKDVRTVYINNTKEKCLLSTENLNETLLLLKKMLKKAMNGELQLNSSIKKYRIGYNWNIRTNELSDEALENEEDYFEKYWLWSTRCIQTWLYNVGDDIIIEISPSYKWHFIEPNESKLYIPFDEFIKNYKEIAVLKIEKNIAKEWIEECQKVLDSLII